MSKYAIVVEDDIGTSSVLSRIAHDFGYSVDTAASIAAARTHYCNKKPDLMLVDVMLPDGNGVDLIEELQNDLSTKFVVITGHPSVDIAIQSLKAHVFDFLKKPFKLAEIRDLLSKASTLQENSSTPHQLNKQSDNDSGLLGDSKPMIGLRETIAHIAKTHASVFIQGESGTGKEVVARRIHSLSGRTGEFVAVNCGSITKDLAASELFGHEKGSFTGAHGRHIGYFESANQGTLLLDEITEMPIDMQTHLLRVLETNTLRRLGGKQEIDVDVRVMAATNRNFQQAIAEGKLRADLYFRLAEFPLILPPLRERGNDVLIIAEDTLKNLNKKYNTNKVLSAEMRQSLCHYDWPGNVRELKNVLHQVFLLSDKELYWKEVAENDSSSAETPGYNVSNLLGKSFWQVEKELIYATLDHHGGNKEKTAKTLGISLKTLYNRLHAYS